MDKGLRGMQGAHTALYFSPSVTGCFENVNTNWKKGEGITNARLLFVPKARFRMAVFFNELPVRLENFHLSCLLLGY